VDTGLAAEGIQEGMLALVLFFSIVGQVVLLVLASIALWMKPHTTFSTVLACCSINALCFVHFMLYGYEIWSSPWLRRYSGFNISLLVVSMYVTVAFVVVVLRLRRKLATYTRESP
jgi:hypothetical protein